LIDLLRPTEPGDPRRTLLYAGAGGLLIPLGESYPALPAGPFGWQVPYPVGSRATPLRLSNCRNNRRALPRSFCLGGLNERKAKKCAHFATASAGIVAIRDISEAMSGPRQDFGSPARGRHGRPAGVAAWLTAASTSAGSRAGWASFRTSAFRRGTTGPRSTAPAP